MKPQFSLKYGEKSFIFSGTSAELEKGVTVTAKVKEYKEYDAFEWVLYFENSSDKNSEVFSDIYDCDIRLPLDIPPAPKRGYMPKEGNLCVVTMQGMVDSDYYWENDHLSAYEYVFIPEYLDKAKDKTKKFNNIGGRSSEGTMPFFDVTANGEGYITGIGWTGNWKSEFTGHENEVQVKTGLREAKFYLKPGEKIRTTSILIMKYEKGEDKYNKFRRLVKNHISHKACTGAERDGIMAYELWGGLKSEEMIKRINELRDYDIKFEDVWLDAGWYCENCEDSFDPAWYDEAGDWEINKVTHPNGLMDVSKAAQDAGMHLMLWMEAERATKNTEVYKSHPEWFLAVDDQESVILNYGNEEAFNYIHDVLCTHIDKLDVSCYRQDFNIHPCNYFKSGDEENREGITQIKHIMGMYRLWDSILEKFPHILIDNCAAGGRRFDIETIRRSVQFFRSDYQCNFNENPEVLQVHNANMSCYLPYNGCTTKTKNDTYAVRSSYTSSWGGAFNNAIFQSMSDEDLKWAKQATDEYLKIRKYFDKDFYNHGSSVLDDTSWAIWQYHDEQTQSGIVMAFRRCESPFEKVNIDLKGMPDGETYTFTDIDTGVSYDASNNISISLPEKRSSAIIEYKIKSNN